jgi:hypothetical protein
MVDGTAPLSSRLSAEPKTKPPIFNHGFHGFELDKTNTPED